MADIDKTNPSVREDHRDTLLDTDKTTPSYAAARSEPLPAMVRAGPVRDTVGTQSVHVEIGADPRVRETARLIASDKVEGTPVRDRNGSKVGTIERVMIDKPSGRVAYAVMSFGGFLGIGQDYMALPWHVLRYNEEIDGYELNIDPDRLRGAPRFSSDGSGDWADDASITRDWERNVHSYYGVDPYW